MSAGSKKECFCTECGGKVPKRMALVTTCKLCDATFCKNHAKDRIEKVGFCKNCYADLSENIKEEIEKVNKKRQYGAIPTLISTMIGLIVIISNLFLGLNVFLLIIGTFFAMIGSFISLGVNKAFKRNLDEIILQIDKKPIHENDDDNTE